MNRPAPRYAPHPSHLVAAPVLAQDRAASHVVAPMPAAVADPAPGAPHASRPRGILERGLDRVLVVQRPLVLAHLRFIHSRHPGAAPADLVSILERRYLTFVTTSGASIGATAVVPAIGTGVTLALSGAETLGFVEATALFAQSLAEVHGLAVEDPDRARALVMALMLGREGADLIRQFGLQTAGRSTRSAYWGEVVTSALPRAAVGPVADRLKSTFIRSFAKKSSASFLGKALPFGVGAAIGGVGNHVLGRRVVASSRTAFGVLSSTHIQADTGISAGSRPSAGTHIHSDTRIPAGTHVPAVTHLPDGDAILRVQPEPV